MSTIEKLEKAREKALADSKEEGREAALLTSIHNLMKNMSLSAQDAMKALGIAAKDQKRLATML